MIQANELRIGNLVQVLGIYKGSFRKAGLVQCDAELIKLCEDDKIGLLPIGLFSEILEKVGLKKDEIHNCYVIYQNESSVDIEYDCENNELTIGGHNSAEPLDHIKYLHQLQNLFYALTGQELEINF